MVYPDSIDNLTDRPSGSEIRSQDPNDAYAALRDVRDEFGAEPTSPQVLGAGSLEPHEGSPSVVALDVGRYNGWSLPESSTLQRLGGFLVVPGSWSTFDIDLWHTTSTGNSGDAGMFVNLLQPSAGEDLGNVDHDSGTVGITAVSTAGTLGVATISSGVTAVGGATLFGTARNASNSADTLTGAFVLVAVVLRKAS